MTSTKPLYDTIGINYAKLRQADPRIFGAIRTALGDIDSVINVGAGAGSYEPDDLAVTALEPSAEMIGQRPATAATAIQGTAESIPFPDNSFDSALAVLTLHHWKDVKKGLEEMQRVARKRIVILTFDPDFKLFWLADYIPELITIDKDWALPMHALKSALPNCKIDPVLIPHDCRDGFLAAYWRRPHAYLDPRLRAAISSFSKIADVQPALDRLETDIESGAWAQKYATLLTKTELDCGYRCVTFDIET